MVGNTDLSSRVPAGGEMRNVSPGSSRPSTRISPSGVSSWLTSEQAVPPLSTKSVSKMGCAIIVTISMPWAPIRFGRPDIGERRWTDGVRRKLALRSAGYYLITLRVTSNGIAFFSRTTSSVQSWERLSRYVISPWAMVRMRKTSVVNTYLIGPNTRGPQRRGRAQPSPM